MARADREARQDKDIGDFEKPKMTTMMESAARHLAAGVMDLDELARLIDADSGKVPGPKVLSSYRSRFRRYGEAWVEASREAKRRWRDENPDKAREASRRGYDSARRVEASQRWQAKNPAKRMLNACRGSAKQRGHECSITAEDIDAMLAPMTCCVTGLPLTWAHVGASKANPWAPSIDRIDCSIGYVPGNVRVVCWAFNQMRGEFPDEVVMTLAKALAARAP